MDRALVFWERLAIPRTTLSNRLAKLVEHGVLSRCRYQDRPERFEYRLTEKGVDLYPVISTIVNWGDQYYADEAGPPILRTHLTCGQDIQPILSCPECGDEIEPRAMTARKRPLNEAYAPVGRGPIADKAS